MKRSRILDEGDQVPQQPLLVHKLPVLNDPTSRTGRTDRCGPRWVYELKIHRLLSSAGTFRYDLHLEPQPFSFVYQNLCGTLVDFYACFSSSEFSTLVAPSCCLYASWPWPGMHCAPRMTWRIFCGVTLTYRGGALQKIADMTENCPKCEHVMEEYLRGTRHFLLTITMPKTSLKIVYFFRSLISHVIHSFY